MSTTTTPKQHTDKSKEAAGAAVDKTKEGVTQATGAVQQGMGAATDALREAAGDAGAAVQHAAAAVGTSVTQGATQATGAVGHGMQSLAGTLRDQGPHQGMLGSATDAAADALEQTGRYIEEKNLSGMVDDITGLIRRNPIPAVALGLCIGFLLGRALRS